MLIYWVSILIPLLATGLDSVPRTSHRPCQNRAPAIRNAHPIKKCRACHAKLHREPFSRPRAERTKAAGGRAVTSGCASSKTPGQKRCACCALAKRRTKRRTMDLRGRRISPRSSGLRAPHRTCPSGPRSRRRRAPRCSDPSASRQVHGDVAPSSSRGRCTPRPCSSSREQGILARCPWSPGPSRKMVPQWSRQWSRQWLNLWNLLNCLRVWFTDALAAPADATTVG